MRNSIATLKSAFVSGQSEIMKIFMILTLLVPTLLPAIACGGGGGGGGGADTPVATLSATDVLAKGDVRQANRFLRSDFSASFLQSGLIAQMQLSLPELEGETILRAAIEIFKTDGLEADGVNFIEDSELESRIVHRDYIDNQTNPLFSIDATSTTNIIFSNGTDTGTLVDRLDPGVNALGIRVKAWFSSNVDTYATNWMHVASATFDKDNLEAGLQLRAANASAGDLAYWEYLLKDLNYDAYENRALIQKGDLGLPGETAGDFILYQPNGHYAGTVATVTDEAVGTEYWQVSPLASSKDNPAFAARFVDWNGARVLDYCVPFVFHAPTVESDVTSD